MKKFLNLLFPIFLILGLCGCTHSNTTDNNINEPVQIAPNGDYRHVLFDNCVIMGESLNGSYLLYNDTISCEGAFYKYSSFNNRYVAIHYMNLTETLDDADDTIKFGAHTVKIDKNCFMIFDSKNQRITEFESIEEFNQECYTNNLHFENWYFRDSKSQNIQINDNCYIEDAGDYRGQVLYYNNVPVFEGIISSYELKNDYLGFDLKVVDLDYGPEFPGKTNQNLNVIEFQSSGKYRIDGTLLLYKIKYQAYIVFDTHTGTFTEYKNKNDANI